MDWVSRMSSAACCAACGRRLEYLLYRLTMLASWKRTMVCCQILMPDEGIVKPALRRQQADMPKARSRLVAENRTVIPSAFAGRRFLGAVSLHELVRLRLIYKHS